MQEEIKFTDKNSLSIFYQIFYEISISVVRDGGKYNSFVIDSDEDLQVLFHCRCQFSEVRTHKLLAKLGYVDDQTGILKIFISNAMNL
ncbi:hypothetical protein Ahy_B10g106064 isoform A [Arachis hypogaea]|uniref:Uncharacterized protein n=1 Tax=Arachis hypogaea TaxID=3818 RepID=A0A444X9N5_ARAHY|nr:hypothetical protein Ahy_B10g106064 isoform A [Arachis hypogaea]